MCIVFILDKIYCTVLFTFSSTVHFELLAGNISVVKIMNHDELFLFINNIKSMAIIFNELSLIFYIIKFFFNFLKTYPKFNGQYMKTWGYTPTSYKYRVP